MLPSHAAAEARAAGLIRHLRAGLRPAPPADLLNLSAGAASCGAGAPVPGKSTLISTLVGAPVQDTGAVREHDARGRHTTTARSLHRLPGGACIIDTPGVRAMRADADAQTVARVFGDVETLASACRFRNCRHEAEPGCAVRVALDADRLRNDHKLLSEAQRDTMSTLDRQRQLATWKARARIGREREREKRGAGRSRVG